MIKTAAGEIVGNVPLRRFIRIKEVQLVTGLPRATVYQKMAEGVFPKNFRLTPRIVGWLADEIAAWQQARIAERDNREAA